MVDLNEVPSKGLDERNINSGGEGKKDDQKEEEMPGEASEAVGKAAIPTYEAIMKLNPSLLKVAEELSDKLEEHYRKTKGSGASCDPRYLQGNSGPSGPSDDGNNPEMLDENGHRYVGLFNQAMTCYLNSLIQTLYMTPEFRNEIYSWKFIGTATTEENNNIPYQLQKLFLLLQTSEKSSLETRALTSSFGWKSSEAFEQHDVQELCRIMFDALEQRWRKMENQSVVQDLYKGTMEDYVKCLRCGTENVRKDVFLDLSLAVRPFGATKSFRSIEEALSAFIKPEILSGNNQYQCEVCASQQDAEKGLRIIEFPYLLTIQLKRFDFDYETLNRIKLNDNVTFPNYLDLNDFVNSTPAPSDDESKLPNHVTMAKKPKQDTPLGDNEQPSNDQCTSTTMEGDVVDSSCADNDIDDTQINLAHWTRTDEDCRSECIDRIMKRGKYVYELFSIMVHQGSASAGHYFAYVKNMVQNRWFCFNDSSVHVASLPDIIRTFGGPSNGWMNNMNAYMLMYRQIDPSRNKHFIRSTALPEHLILLRDKLQREEEERIRQQETEQSSIRVVYICNEPHCIERQNTMLFPMDYSVEAVHDKIMSELNSHKQLDTHSENDCEGCASDGGHFVEHSLAECQRLIMCNQDWEFERVITDFDTAVEQPLVEGTGDDLTVVGGDDPNKRSLSSFFPSDEVFLTKFIRTLYFLVDSKHSAERPFYQIAAEESQTLNGPKQEGQLRTIKVLTVDVGRKCVKLVKLIALPERATIGELKMVLTHTVRRVAESEEISAKAVPETDQRSQEGEELFQQLHCRVVFDSQLNDEDDSSLSVFAKRHSATNLKCLYELGLTQCGMLSVFVDVGAAECLLADRAISDFDSTEMKKLIMDLKSAQKDDERPSMETKSLERYLNFVIDQSALEYNPEAMKQWQQRKLGEGTMEEPPMDISSCPGTPQISPMVSADEGDGHD